MPFYQNEVLARYKTSSMDDNALQISDEDFNKIRDHQRNGGTVNIGPDGTIEYHNAPAPDPDVENQAIAEAVVMQYMVKEKVAELQWDSSKQYHIDDVVYHNGAMWRATSNNSNNEPDDVPGDWEQIP